MSVSKQKKEKRIVGAIVFVVLSIPTVATLLFLYYMYSPTHVVTKSYSISSVESVYFDAYNANLSIEQGDKPQLRIEAEKRMFKPFGIYDEQVGFEEDKEENSISLYIYDKDRSNAEFDIDISNFFFSSREYGPVQFTLVVPDLDYVEVNSDYGFYGEIHINDLITDALSVKMYGGRDAYISNLTADELLVDIKGVTLNASGVVGNQDVRVRDYGAWELGAQLNGEYNALQLASQTANILQRNGSATVTVSDILYAKVRDGGVINYVGEPEVILDEKNNGTVKQID